MRITLATVAMVILLTASLNAPTTIAGAQEKKPKPAPAPMGEPSVRIHQVPGGNAEAIAKLLQEVFPKARIVALGSNQIAVWADPQTHLDLAKQQPLAPGVTMVIPLDGLNPAKTAATLKSMLGDPKTGGPFVEASTSPNSLRVRGSREQIDEIRDVLATLAKNSGPYRINLQGAGILTIVLEKGSANTLAEALRDMIPKLRKNPVTVVMPGKADEAPKKAPTPPDKGDAKPGKMPAPITIIAIGNQISVTCEDKEALALVEQVVRIFLNTESSSNFEVIRLKSATAIDVARIVDETFNGPAKNRSERIRVIADPATNAVIVSARPLDALTIRRLVTSELDRPVAPR
jgi:type II secretory pathway component GspD/PulD (secretin)